MTGTKVPRLLSIVRNNDPRKVIPSFFCPIIISTTDHTNIVHLNTPIYKGFCSDSSNGILVSLYSTDAVRKQTLTLSSFFLILSHNS